jgi:hypothetical protein
VLGAVLNRAPARAHGEYADYYADYYGSEAETKTGMKKRLSISEESPNRTTR